MSISFTLSINQFHKAEEVATALFLLTEHIESGKGLEVSNNELIAHDHTAMDTYALEVLRSLLLRAHELGLYSIYSDQMETVRTQCDKIIASYPVKIDILSSVPKGVEEKILFRLAYKTRVRSLRVSKNWQSMILGSKSHEVANFSKYPFGKQLFHEHFKTFTECVDWLESHPKRFELLYPNFIHVPGVSKEQMTRLCKLCPYIAGISYTKSPDDKTDYISIIRTLKFRPFIAEY